MGSSQFHLPALLDMGWAGGLTGGGGQQGPGTGSRLGTLLRDIRGGQASGGGGGGFSKEIEEPR